MKLLLPIVTVDAVLTGKSAPLGPNGEMSAMNKQVTQDRVYLGTEGLLGDEQADRRHHGGAEKALHHFPAEHYPLMRKHLKKYTDGAFAVGRFGENISTTGLTESDVCIGDIFQLGEAIIQVSQGRQPCWKLNARYDYPEMAKQVQSLKTTGWYYRVITPGYLQAGDSLVLLQRPYPDWPIARLLGYLFEDTLNLTALKAMVDIPYLAQTWRDMAQKRIDSGQVESWQHRLTTPSTQQ